MKSRFLPPQLSRRPFIYGHRGCRGLRPENTIPAFLHALDWGVDGLELDVIISADGQVVVSHEPWLNAAICTGPAEQILTEETGRAFNLFQASYATIRQCDCGSLRHPRFPEQVVAPAYKPLLSEVFETVASHCRVAQRPLPAYSIELKSTPNSDGLFHPAPTVFVQSVAQVVEDARVNGWVAETLLMSFDHRVVQAARELTQYPVCLLIEDTQPLPEHLMSLGFLPDVIGPDFALLSDDFLHHCREHSLPVVAWTVNDPASMLQLAQLGVYGITTDYPDRASRLFNL